jgi:hypothetical protein
MGRSCKINLSRKEPSATFPNIASSLKGIRKKLIAIFSHKDTKAQRHKVVVRNLPLFFAIFAPANLWFDAVKNSSNAKTAKIAKRKTRPDYLQSKVVRWYLIAFFLYIPNR